MNTSIVCLNEGTIDISEGLSCQLTLLRLVSRFQGWDLLSIAGIWKLEPMTIRNCWICWLLSRWARLMPRREQEELAGRHLASAINSIPRMPLMNWRPTLSQKYLEVNLVDHSFNSRPLESLLFLNLSSWTSHLAKPLKSVWQFSEKLELWPLSPSRTSPLMEDNLANCHCHLVCLTYCFYLSNSSANRSCSVCWASCL